MEAVEKRKGDFRGQEKNICKDAHHFMNSTYRVKTDIHNYSKNTSSLPGRPLQVSVKLS